MQGIDLERAADLACAAADAAREEILPRFRRVAVETKSDGSPVTEADRAAERAIRAVLREGAPDWGILGEEYGSEGVSDPRTEDRPYWLVDPIDGTIGFARGIPLFTTLIALVVGGEPVLGLIDLPALDERTLGWRGGGVRRNGTDVRVSAQVQLEQALVAVCDLECFPAAGVDGGFERISAAAGRVRGYTDAFGHALVLGGSVDAMVDLHISAWDAGPARALVPEAGGACTVREGADGNLGLVIGSAALVGRLEALLDA